MSGGTEPRTSKAENFARLAASRSGRIRADLKLLRNLMRSSYQSTPDQRCQIIGNLQASLDDLAQAWSVGNGGAQAVTPRPAQSPARRAQDRPAGLESRGGSATVDGHDRRDIRDAALQIATGDISGGVAALRKVILGWPVPDKRKGAADAAAAP